MEVTHNLSPTRVTTQQQIVFNLLQHSGEHLSAEDIYHQARKTLPRISLATVYRNLEQMVDRNLISKVLVSGVARFEAKTHQHYHVLCLSCGLLDNLDSIPATDIEDFFSRSTSYKLTGHDLMLYGLCPRCQKKR